MLTNILILLAGLALVVFGADYLVDGASGIARKAGLSEFLIGLTIVGIGTSTPEMVVSFFGAFQGKSDVAIGNVIGSNIFNILFILGTTTAIHPVSFTMENLVDDVMLILFSIMVWGFSATDGGKLVKREGITMLACYVGFVAYAIWRVYGVS